MTTNAYKIKESISNVLKEQADQISTFTKGKNLFTDQVFPPDQSSIYSGKTNFSEVNKPSASFMKKVTNGAIDTNLAANKDKISWKRLSELYDIKKLNVLKEPKEIKTQPDILSEDVIQGELGDCYLLSAFASIAEEPQRIKRLFSNILISPNGVYEITVFLHGEPIKIIVDDYVLVKDLSTEEEPNKFSLVSTKINEKTMNIWPILLEKVWAKINLNYENIISGNCSDAFEFFSPAPYTTLYHNVHQDVVFSEIKKAKENNFIVCCDISSLNSSKDLNKLKALGLISSHAYSILDVAEVSDLKGNKTQILQIRNPWGTNEWQGDWSDKSTKWTPELKQMLNFKDEEDGIFWISIQDYLKFYTSTHILHERSNYYYANIRALFNKGQEFNLFKINVPKNTSGAFIMNQKNTRVYKNLLEKENFENLYGSMIVYKYNSNGEVIALGADSGKKNRMFVELEEIEKGEYFIAVNFPDQYPEIVKNNNFEKNKHLTIEQLSIRIGVYSSISGVTIDDIPETTDDFKGFFLDYIRDASRNVSNKYHFEDEGEKESYRAAYFDQGSAYGYVFYENKSEGFINEIITFNELENINIYPILRIGELISLKTLISKAEDPEEIKQLQSIKKQIDLNSSIEVLRTVKTVNTVSKKTPVEIKVKIAPNTCGVILLEKSNEQAKVDFESKLVITYPIHTILTDNKFQSETTKIKYNNSLIDIFETIIEHTNGVIIRYRNRTKDFNFGVHLKFNELKNLAIKLSSDELVHTRLSQLQNLEVSENERSKFDKVEQNTKGFEDFVINVKDPDKEASLVVEPGQVKFIQLEALDVFDTFSYSLESTFYLSRSKGL